jgi:hypothetical protein
MIIDNIKNMSNGWFIGDFQPSIVKTNLFEIGHHHYKKGFVGQKHIHKIATEINYIIKGKLIASGKELTSGDIWIYEPEEISDVTFLEDTDLIIIKHPSITDDKYLVE